MFSNRLDAKHIVRAETVVSIEGLIGEHSSIENGQYTLDYLAFMAKMQHFAQVTVPQYEAYVALKNPRQS